MGRVLFPQLWFGGPQAQKQKVVLMLTLGHRDLSEHVSSDLAEHQEASLQVCGGGCCFALLEIKIIDLVPTLICSKTLRKGLSRKTSKNSLSYG